MSLQVCHCGWSKVTTYQGLRIHQGRMGCTQRGVRGAESEQQNMWGNVGLPNKQQDLWVDVYASFKTDTTDCSSQTSLQVCHCGWSKVTTYQGLRIHQGKMGCTRRGVRVAESEQQNMWGNVGLPNKQQDLWMDVYASIKTETTADCSSGKSLQVCHCGWKKETTYQGLRIHQGKMGCTPKGMSIPEREQHYWKNQWEEVDHKKHQPAKKVIAKKENAPVPLRINVRTKSAAPTAPIKEEYEASALPRRSATLREFSTSVQANRSIRERPATIYQVPAARPKERNNQITIKQEPYTPFPIPQRPFQTATNSESSNELHDFPSALQVNKPVRERPTPPPRPLVVPPEKKKGKHQTSSQVNKPVRERPTLPPRPLVVPPKKEGKDQASPQMCAAKARQERLKSELELEIQMREEKLQKKAAERVCENVPDPTSTTTQTNSAAADAVSKEDLKSLSETAQDSDISTGMKVKQLALMFSASTQKTAAVQQPKEKLQEQQKLPQAKPLVQKFLAATAQETAVQRPKEKHEEERKLPQAKTLAQKFLAATAQETAVQPKKQDREDQKLSPMPDSTSATTRTNPAAAEAPRKEDPKAPCETAQLCDFSAGLKVKQLAWMFSGKTHKTAVRPKEKQNEKRKPAQVTEDKSESELEQIIQMTEEKMSNIRAAERACENVPDPTSNTTQTNSAAADAVSKEDLKSLSETAQDSDISTGMKVKQLALMFSASTQKTAAVQQPKEKLQEQQKLPQAKPLVQKFLAATAQETAVQRPKEKHEEERKLPQMPDSTSATTKTNPVAAEAPRKEDPKASCETAQPCDFSAGQKVPDTTSATTKMNPAATEATTNRDPKALSETAQLSDCSTGLNVKQLAWMFSATHQETAVQLKEKHQEERKPEQVKLSAATAQETAKGKERDDQKLSQVRQDRVPTDVKQKVEMRELNVAEDRSSGKACKPSEGSLDRGPMEITGELSEVMEDARQKSPDLKFSNTKSTKTEQIQQKLEKPSSNDLEWIAKFAVDVKLDPTTAHRCLVSADGTKVRDEQETNVADAPERCDLFGSVLGLNKLTSWKSYWEVEVSNKTGWDLGVARGDANRKGKLLLNPDEGYWAIVHFKNKEYAALTAPPVHLSLKENLQKVGVFVDYEGGLVSFYNVPAKSHIYSFTQCSFTGEICPYFSLHLGEIADPLIISTMKHQ